MLQCDSYFATMIVASEPKDKSIPFSESIKLRTNHADPKVQSTCEALPGTSDLEHCPPESSGKDHEYCLCSV